jgi:uncharacterized membrane protein YhaH (DUF805 family)
MAYPHDPQQPRYGEQPSDPQPRYGQVPPALPQDAQPPYGQFPPAPPQHGPFPYGQAPQFAAAPQYVLPMDPQAMFDGAQHPDDLARPLYGASFGDAMKRFFRQYADFTGRASRSEYWWAALGVGLISLVPVVVMMIGLISATVWVSAQSYGSSGPSLSAAPLFGVYLLGLILTMAVSLGLLVPQLALCWRRLHDANYAGPMYFLTFVPYAGSIILLVLMMQSSKPQGRRFDLPR